MTTKIEPHYVFVHPLNLEEHFIALIVREDQSIPESHLIYTFNDFNIPYAQLGWHELLPGDALFGGEFFFNSDSPGFEYFLEVYTKDKGALRFESCDFDELLNILDCIRDGIDYT